MASSPAAQIKEHRLTRDQELRFEVGAKPITVEILAGTAEIFGFPLKQYHKYAFPSNYRGAIYTYTAATIEVVGTLEIEYIATRADKPMLIYLNIHAGLRELRERAVTAAAAAAAADDEAVATVGPIVLITGPKHVGKTTLCELYCNYAVRDTTPVLYVDLDVDQNSVMPGCMSVVPVESLADAVNGFDTSTPFSYCYGHLNAMANQKLYNLQMKNLAEVVSKKLATSRFRAGGAIIDTSAWNKGDYYDSVVQAAELFNVKLVIVLDHERMYADLSRDLPNFIKILHVPKSGGAEALTPQQEGDQRKLTIFRYFYGTKLIPLFPRFFEFTYDCAPEELTLRIARVGVEALPASCLPYGMAPDEHQTMVEYVSYTPALNNHVIALIEPVASLSSAIIKKPVLGFVLIKQVNAETKMVEVLLPADAPPVSRLGVLNECIFLDDVVDRI